jgi:phosphatidylserine decarboxylase
VIGGQNLASKDKTGYSDPYCVVNLHNQKRKTATLMQTLFPRWNQLLTFGVPDVLEGQSLFVVCMDFDQVGSDDFMGEFILDISKLTAENPFLEVCLCSVVRVCVCIFLLS